MSRKKPKTRAVWAFTWWDIESDSAWGDDGTPCPVCVSVGFIVAKPRKKDRCPVWRIADAWSENEPGGVTKIPASVVKSRRKLGDVEVPWR